MHVQSCQENFPPPLPSAQQRPLTFPVPSLGGGRLRPEGGRAGGRLSSRRTRLSASSQPSPALPAGPGSPGSGGKVRTRSAGARHAAEQTGWPRLARDPARCKTVRAKRPDPVAGTGSSGRARRTALAPGPVRPRRTWSAAPRASAPRSLPGVRQSSRARRRSLRQAGPRPPHVGTPRPAHAPPTPRPASTSLPAPLRGGTVAASFRYPGHVG